MNKNIFFLILMAVIMNFSLVSCGGDDDSPSPAPEETNTGGSNNSDDGTTNNPGGGTNNPGSDDSDYRDEGLNPSTKDNNPMAIDLGLSVNWSNKNLGAKYDYEPGGSYGWADSPGYFFIADLSYYPQGNLPSSISGTNYDAARWHWGGNWRLPTKVEVEELINNCEFEWVKDDASQGGTNSLKMLLKVTSRKNGKSIYFPSSNIRLKKKVTNDGREGQYWTGDLSSNTDMASSFAFYGAAEVRTYTYYRYYGLSIRPVCSK